MRFFRVLSLASCAFIKIVSEFGRLPLIGVADRDLNNKVGKPENAIR